MAHLRTLVSYFLTLAICASAAGQPDLFKQHHDLMLKAIGDNQPQKVRALLATPYVFVNDPAYETSYLADAAISGPGRDEIVQILLDAGEDVQWRNRGDFSIFHFLAGNHRTDTIWNVLLAGLSKSTGGFSSPVFKAVINLRTNSQSGSPGYTALFYLVDRTETHLHNENEAVLVAKQLIEVAGADPNIPRDNGVTPLQVAQVRHLAALTSYLQQHGAH